MIQSLCTFYNRQWQNAEAMTSRRYHHLLEKIHRKGLWKTRAILGRLLRRYFQTLAILDRQEMGITTENRGTQVTVSLTSFPARIDTVWLTVETLLRQTAKPDKIILWLAKEQFPGGIDELPQRLIAQRQRGLTIRFCDDLKPHKKYFYTLKEYPQDIIITVDDDIFYPENTVQEFLRLNKQYPDCICCNRARKVVFNDDNSIAKFSRWEMASVDLGPSKLLCPIGMGGVLYPPGALDKEVLNKNVLVDLCLCADDLWLKVMSLRQGTKVVVSSVLTNELFAVPGAQHGALSSLNVGQNANDRQLAALLNRYEVHFTTPEPKQATEPVLDQC